MDYLTFNPSKPLTLGVELELQLINPNSYDLCSQAKELLRLVQNTNYKEYLKPEATQSMIEINSTVHEHTHTLLTELMEVKEFLAGEAAKLNLRIAGGGAHPFQRWSARTLFPNQRMRGLSRLYGYLMKQLTVFGLHIHIGCPNGDDALYLCHMFSRYVPQFIALSASSPFYQGVDTSFHSSRINVISAFPHSGVLPYTLKWDEFSDYFKRMYDLKIVKSMKDFYWDIRPKPEYGTVELRICDMPLTIEKVVAIAAYAQTLAHYLLNEKPDCIPAEAYHIYSYNRFQASRFGLAGNFINPITEQHTVIKDDILETIKIINPSAKNLGNQAFLDEINEEAAASENDTNWLREIFNRTGALNETVRMQCNLWDGDF